MYIFLFSNISKYRDRNPKRKRNWVGWFWVSEFAPQSKLRSGALG